MENYKGFGRKWSWANWGTVPEFSWVDWGKPWSILVTSAGVSADIQTQHLPGVTSELTCSVAHLLLNMYTCPLTFLYLPLWICIIIGLCIKLPSPPPQRKRRWQRLAFTTEISYDLVTFRRKRILYVKVILLSFMKLVRLLSAHPVLLF
jgi:hypothetical protein